MHYKHALAAAAFVIALPSAMAEQLKITVGAVGITGYVANEDFGWFPDGSTFELQWSTIYDTDSLVDTLPPVTGQRTTALSGEMVINIGGTEIRSSTAPDSANYFGVRHGTWQSPTQPSVSVSSPSFYNGHYYSFETTAFPTTLPGALLAKPGTLSYTAADGITFQLDSWLGDGSGNGYIQLLPSMLNITVSAVPEPGTYAMLLAGLALVGFAAKRRRA